MKNVFCATLILLHMTIGLLATQRQRSIVPYSYIPHTHILQNFAMTRDGMFHYQEDTDKTIFKRMIEPNSSENRYNEEETDNTYSQYFKSWNFFDTHNTYPHTKEEFQAYNSWESLKEKNILAHAKVETYKQLAHRGYQYAGGIAGSVAFLALATYTNNNATSYLAKAAPLIGAGVGGAFVGSTIGRSLMDQQQEEIDEAFNEYEKQKEAGVNVELYEKIHLIHTLLYDSASALYGAI